MSNETPGYESKSLIQHSQAENSKPQRPSGTGFGVSLLAALLLFAAGATSWAAEEFRAAWADVFHVGMSSQTEVNNMVSALVTGHYNAVVVQVVGYMDSGTASHGAHWKSSILPWSTRVTSGFDPLAYLCTQAHANGIEVHAWLGGSGPISRLRTLRSSTLIPRPTWCSGSTERAEHHDCCCSSQPEFRALTRIPLCNAGFFERCCLPQD